MIPSAKSEGVETLKLHLRADGIPYEQEVKFHPVRKWRLDFALAGRLGVEIDGGIWVQGRHSRGAGMEADNEKNNEAVLLGWRILYFSTGQVKSGLAIDTIKRAM